MKVTFVALGQESLGVSILSAVLRRAGHQTSLAFNPALFHDRYYLDVPRLAAIFDRTSRMIDEIVEAAPDLVAFSVMTPVYQWCVQVAQALKARLDVPIIFGGVHPSAVPEICLDNACVDYVCVGEGEQALLELCEALPSSGGRPAQPIANLWWRDGDRLVRGPAAPFNQDLDALPYWDKDLWRGHIRIADNYLTMTSRGCPYRCTFCFNNFFAKLPGRGGGKYVRQRSVAHVMGELLDAKARFGIRRVDFEDDIFTVDKEWIRAFLVEYRREIGVPFQCLVHPRYIDREVARWLKDAGCQHVQMGVQSADEEYKRRQLLRMEKDAHLRDALAALAETGLPTKLDHMLGLPGEPPSAQERARELYAEFPPRRVQTFWLTHLPGIELTRDAVKMGSVTVEEYDRINRGETGLFHSRSAPGVSDQSFYRRYELLFRLMPLLPRAARQRLRAEHLPKLPAGLNALAGAALEMVNLLWHRDAEALNYARHYAHQLRRQLPELWRYRPVPTTEAIGAATTPAVPQRASAADQSAAAPVRISLVRS
jgi:anaerobic magnesium-protoporphyrin IX monomethyl ester cyclase